MVSYTLKTGGDAQLHTEDLDPTRGRRKKSILRIVFNRMCDDAELAQETPEFCLFPIPHTHTSLVSNLP